MGAEPYDYTVPYEPDIQAALDKLRSRVFESKQFNGAEFDPPTPEAALELTDADGTPRFSTSAVSATTPTTSAPLPYPLKNSNGTSARRSRPRSWCGNLMTSGRTLSEERLDT